MIGLFLRGALAWLTGGGIVASLAVAGLGVGAGFVGGKVGGYFACKERLEVASLKAQLAGTEDALEGSRKLRDLEVKRSAALSDEIRAVEEARNDVMPTLVIPVSDSCKWAPDERRRVLDRIPIGKPGPAGARTGR